jgi:hypothetical protein
VRLIKKFFLINTHQYNKLSGYIKQGREKDVSCARRMIVKHTQAELHLPEREMKFGVEIF